MFNTANNDCPCKGCTSETGRSSSCHGECERYKDWTIMKDKRNAVVKAKRDKDKLIHEDMVYRICKMQRRGIS